VEEEDFLIDRLNPVKRKPTRFQVLPAVDFVEPAEVEGSVLARLGLGAGSRVTMSQWEAMLAADCEERCRVAAWKLLSTRAHGRAELTRSLRKRRFPATVAEAIVADLAAKGYLDDAAFAQTYARERSARREGPARIEQRLRARGISREEAKAAIEPMQDPAKLLAVAIDLLTRWNRRSKPADPAKRLQAAAAYLVRQGYSFDTARKATRRVMGNEPED